MMNTKRTKDHVPWNRIKEVSANNAIEVWDKKKESSNDRSHSSVWVSKKESPRGLIETTMIE